MAWRAGLGTVMAVVVWGLSGCTPPTRAAMVPRLVVHVRAADQQRSREGADGAWVRHAHWDVAVHAALRWRMSRPSSRFSSWAPPLP